MCNDGSLSTCQLKPQLYLTDLQGLLLLMMMWNNNIAEIAFSLTAPEHASLEGPLHLRHLSMCRTCALLSVVTTCRCWTSYQTVFSAAGVA